jgi:hypothetical protein
MQEIHYPKAKVLNRFIARLIDLLFVAALFEISSRIGFVAGITYLLFADGFSEGKSLGKWLIGLQTFVPVNQSVCTFKESIIRNSPVAAGYLLFFVPYVGWIFTAAILIFEGLLVIGNEHGLRLGDEMAGTQVLERAAHDVGVEQ